MRLAIVILALSSASGQVLELATRLDDLVRGEMASNNIQALSIALVDRDRILWSKDFNTPAGTVYRVGSVSKLFTDIAIMQLVERGQLDLDASVTRYIPEFNKRVTLRQLMTHRSGLVREPPVGNYFDATSPTLRQTVLSLNDTELVYPPGERTKYSNAGIAVAGYVVEQVRKEPFQTCVKNMVLDPLSMTQSTFEPRSAAKAWMSTLDGRTFPAPTFALGMSPAGSIYSTTGDLARFAMALLAKGDPLLKPGTLEQMWVPQYGSDYGLGFRIGKLEGPRMVGHGGAIYGFATALQMLPEQRLAAIVIANKDGANASVDRIASQALRYMQEPRRIQSSAPPASAPAAWVPLIGEYGWDYNTLYIHERDGKLTSLIEWFFFDPLTPIAPDVFSYPDSGLYAGEQAVFQRDAAGIVTGVRIGGVLFPRRPDPAAPGATFRIEPVRPVSKLLKEARSAQPPVESGSFRSPDLVEIAKLSPSLKLDIRYASTNNFMSTAFYTQARAFLQRPAAEALLRAHEKLKPLGYGLMIHDAYRPWYLTKMFWDGTPSDKHEFVADPAKGSRHNRGCAVDLTLYDLASGAPIRMTGGYDEMSERSYPKYQGGTSVQRWHRDLLRRIMEDEGFQVYESEWWHFDYKDWKEYPILNKRFEEL